ncbi:hypothetical protein [Streptomyces sp. 2231.1]|uniref:hypothetical protein n=1 Tax=Streptomyces sp. 2231.1 TaxID=1855347 RepID=UPI0015A06E0A|nr:hypothetical protein [Streptomyces sp. 2231.1]
MRSRAPDSRLRGEFVSAAAAPLGRQDGGVVDEAAACHLASLPALRPGVSGYARRVSGHRAGSLRPAEVAARRSWDRRSGVLDALAYLHQHRPAARP